MAVLNDASRQDAARRLIRNMFVEANATANMDYATIKAAVDAADDWREANAAAFNTALPAAFRNTASVQQKSLLLCYVVMKNAGLI